MGVVSEEGRGCDGFFEGGPGGEGKGPLGSRGATRGSRSRGGKTLRTEVGSRRRVIDPLEPFSDFERRGVKGGDTLSVILSRRECFSSLRRHGRVVNLLEAVLTITVNGEEGRYVGRGPFRT